ncbi:MAG: electron transport complex subunit RsxC [Desulfobulbus sp.]
MTTLFTFPKGGVHPPEAKSQTAELSIEMMPVPDTLELILGQHIGAPCTPVVKKKDLVKEGDLLGTVPKGLGTPLHAPVQGSIIALGMSGHPVRISSPSVTMSVDHSIPCRQYSRQSWAGKKPEELLEAIKQGGIVGMGGAGFPTHVKLRPPTEPAVDTLVLNGAECEPYITSDDRQMRDAAAEIVEGARILLKILGIRDCLIGIEANKPEAIAAMSHAAQATCSKEASISVRTLRVKYPQGAEKQLILALTGRKVPAGALPSAVGVVVQNVSTTKAVYDVVVYGKPLYEKTLTIAGKGIVRPANLRVKIGTKIQDIVTYLGGLRPELAKIVVGGPMMGFAVSSLDIPVTKTTSAVLFLTEEEIDTHPHSQCIRCGWCLEACPMGLEPKEIGLFVEAGRPQETAQFGVLDCFECGSCAYACPAKRPLVQFIRLAKMKIKR